MAKAYSAGQLLGMARALVWIGEYLQDWRAYADLHGIYAWQSRGRRLQLAQIALLTRIAAGGPDVNGNADHHLYEFAYGRGY